MKPNLVGSHDRAFNKATSTSSDTKLETLLSALDATQIDLATKAKIKFDKVENELAVANKRGIVFDEVINNNTALELQKVLNKLEQENLLRSDDFVKAYPLTSELLGLN